MEFHSNLSLQIWCVEINEKRAIEMLFHRSDCKTTLRRRNIWHSLSCGEQQQGMHVNSRAIIRRRHKNPLRSFFTAKGLRREFVTVFTITFRAFGRFRGWSRTTNGNVMMKMMCGGIGGEESEAGTWANMMVHEELKQTIIIYMHRINICFLFLVLLDFSVLCFSLSMRHTVQPYIDSSERKRRRHHRRMRQSLCWCYVCGGGC